MTAISFENALGIHPLAMEVRTRRAEMIANNLANAETPGFKASDLDFKKVLGAASENDFVVTMQQTDPNHIGIVKLDSSAEKWVDDAVFERQALQPSQDGNTVDVQRESAEFTKNALDFAASFRFLNGKFSSLSRAIKGE